MKKFGKFLFGTISIATVAAGAYYVYKKFIKNDDSDDFDEFEDEFDDFDDFDAEEDGSTDSSDSREYVSIHIDKEDNKPDMTATASDDFVVPDGTEMEQE